MRRNEDTAGFAAGRFCIFVDIGVDGTADCTQAVMAVGKYTRHRELLESARIGSLKDSDIGIIVDTHGIKLNLQMLHIVRMIVLGKHLPG